MERINKILEKWKTIIINQSKAMIELGDIIFFLLKHSTIRKEVALQLEERIKEIIAGLAKLE